MSEDSLAIAPPSGVVLMQKSPSTAFCRSILFPGLGQRYIQEKRKGILFTGIEIGLLGATLYEHNRTRHYDDQLGRVSNDQYNSIHKKYVDHYDRRQNLIWINVAFWLYNAADAYVYAHFIDFDKPLDLSMQHNAADNSTVLYIELTACRF
ncbi:MAG: hypothetical protein B6244_04810 [Candidatus Cloacimonetes bacterium 4572_55]|nr:MAG: hypothetical protein B6244_04810 [Candidatus Cloacimonetes bacterium 4572_55]